MKSLNNYIKKKNSRKILFTPGPASLSKENIEGLEPAFGRGDVQYDSDLKYVLKKLKSFSKHKKIVCMQGSGSFAIELMCYNFLKGNVLVVNTGYYAKRIISICKNLKKLRRIKNVFEIDWKLFNKYKSNKKIDWMIACPTETSIGLRLPIKDLYRFSKKIKSKLMLDSTASFPIEKNHNLADVISYSSCKALCGLTGASFINYNSKPNYFHNSFYLNLKNHEKKKMTGPYHTILSLKNVLKKYSGFKQSIINNKKYFQKKFRKNLIYKSKNQPLLCTYINKQITPKLKKVILYRSRSKIIGSVVSHLGEAHLKEKSKGSIINFLKNE